MSANSSWLQNDVTGWAASPAKAALAQVAELVGTAGELQVKVAPDGERFEAEAKPGRKGLLGARGSVTDGVVVVRLDILRAARDVRVPAAAVFRRLGDALGDRCRLVVTEDDGGQLVQVELRAQGTPMSLARASALADQLGAVDALAAALVAELPVAPSDADLVKLYAPHAEVLEGVRALGADLGTALDGWAADTLDYVAGGLSVALAVPPDAPVVEDYALAALAKAARGRGSTIGRVILPALDARMLLEIARKAPGRVAVPGARLALGTNPYELAGQAAGALASLTSANRPCLFTGSMEALGGLFSGGQGGSADPLRPVVRRVPDPPLADLARFAVRAAAHDGGGLPPAAESELAAELGGAVIDRSRLGDAKRLVAPLARRLVLAWNDGAQREPAAWAAQIGELTETLAGLSSRPRALRAPAVQARAVQVLADRSLAGWLKTELVGQDEALVDLAERVREEVLARPPHQPIRWAALGTPGTGKSQSAVLLARRLEVPYVIFDAASLSDYHTATAQLLGSGRGIVGSYQAGRLEQAAKHHTGVVVEVSDIDHAPPNVRSFLADLFLQVLETGEAQSGTGAVFSCANVIFAFTMNLPDGADERVRRRVGFGELSEAEVTCRVGEEVKGMLSGAFVSRIGTPILFDPIDDLARETIVHRTITSSVARAAESLAGPPAEVVVEPGVARAVVQSQPAGVRAFGARALMEHARKAAIRALPDEADLRAGARIVVHIGPDGAIAIRSEQP